MLFKRLACTSVVGMALAVAGACTSVPNHPAAGSRASQQPGENDPGALLVLGINQGTEGDIETAKATFTRVTALDKNNKFAWFNLGVIAQSKGDTGEAKNAYDAALAIDPAFASALYNKAILIEGTDADAAIAIYRKILTIDANASTTNLRLGLMLDRKGDRDAALEHFRSAVRTNASLLASVPTAYQAKVKGG